MQRNELLRGKGYQDAIAQGPRTKSLEAETFTRPVMLKAEEDILYSFSFSLLHEAILE